MDNTTAWAVVTAALGASLLTVFGTWWLDVRRNVRVSQRSDRGQLVAACNEMVSSAMGLMLRTGILAEAGILLSGPTAGLDIVMHIRKPLDPVELGDWLNSDLRQMLSAQALVWQFGDEGLIRQAAKAVEAAAALTETMSIAASIEPGKDADWNERLASWLQRFRQAQRDTKKVAEREQKARVLGRECRVLADIMRRKLGVDDAAALLRAFPVTDSETAAQGSADGHGAGRETGVSRERS
jgi:hypothetical protein